jgi:hypothetical protein
MADTHAFGVAKALIFVLSFTAAGGAGYIVFSCVSKDRKLFEDAFIHREE